MPNDAENEVEMPLYRCHKVVHALKIKWVAGKAGTIEPGSKDAAVLFFSEPGYGPLEVNAEYVAKHAPKAGGYYVVYEDGYKSWSPADTFEAGYTRL